MRAHALRRLLVLAVILAFVAAACGEEAEETTTTTAAITTTTGGAASTTTTTSGETTTTTAPFVIEPGLTGLSVVDDLTFTVTMAEADPEFPLKLAYAAYFPMPKVAFDDPAAFEESPIGNGPFMMDGAWEHDVVIPLKRFEGYAGPDPAQVDILEWTIIDDLNTAYNEVRAGNLDILGPALPTDQIATAAAEFGDRYGLSSSTSFTYFGFPLYLPEFQDLDVRRALSMAIDRDLIVEQIYAEHPRGGVLDPAPDLPGSAGARLRQLGLQPRRGQGPLGLHRPPRLADRLVQHRRRPRGLGRSRGQHVAQHPGRRRHHLREPGVLGVQPAARRAGGHRPLPPRLGAGLPLPAELPGAPVRLVQHPADRLEQHLVQQPGVRRVDRPGQDGGGGHAATSPTASRSTSRPKTSCAATCPSPRCGSGPTSSSSPRASGTSSTTPTATSG